jgi:PAS domain S-box-containing protein
MASYLLFGAFFQSALITLILALKVSKRDLSAVLSTSWMFFFTVALMSWTYETTYKMPLSEIFTPIWYALGPVFYYSIRFSFLPAKSQTSWRWVWSLVPWGIELAVSIGYFLTYFFDFNLAKKIKDFGSDYEQFSFFYFVLFLMASLVFLIKNKAFITMNIAYKKQLKWIKYLVFVSLLFIAIHLCGGHNEALLTGILSSFFTAAFLFHLGSNVQIFSKANFQNTELLKEALNERTKAVIITNKNRVAEYINEPFLDMTGYRHRDIIGRKPSFLQGVLTTSESVDFVREKLAEAVEFEADIINYRKNGEAYICHIHINPIFSDGELTHFIGYETDGGTIAEAAPFEDELLIFEALKDYFDIEKPYKNKQLQAADIADVLTISPRRLGEILKKCEEQSFSDFVNKYRVQEVIKMLENEAAERMTIEAIGLESGFNSKTAFLRAFKKETGETPSAFLLQESATF